MKQVYLDNTKIHDSQSINPYYLQPLMEGLEMPELRLGSSELPGQHGAIVGNHLYGSRLITLRGRIRAGTITEYRARRRALEQAVGIRTYQGNVLPRTLKLLTMDDLWLQTEVYTRKFTMDEQYMSHGEFSLELLAPDYRFLSMNETVEVIHVFSGGGWGLPMDLTTGLDMSVGGDTIGNTGEILNHGNAPASPNFLLVGQMEDPSLVNQTTGEQLSLNYNLSDGDYIEIDTNLSTVRHINGSVITNIQQYFAGSFFELQPGANVLKLTVTSNNSAAKVYVRYRNSYLGT